MGKNVIQMPAPQRKLSEAEKQEAIQRAFMQQYNSIAQGVLFNMVRGESPGRPADEIASKAHSIAAQFLLQSAESAQGVYDELVRKAQEEKAKEGE